MYSVQENHNIELFVTLDNYLPSQSACLTVTLIITYRLTFFMRVKNGHIRCFISFNHILLLQPSLETAHCNFGNNCIKFSKFWLWTHYSLCHFIYFCSWQFQSLTGVLSLDMYNPLWLTGLKTPTRPTKVTLTALSEFFFFSAFLIHKLWCTQNHGLLVCKQKFWLPRLTFHSKQWLFLPLHCFIWRARLHVHWSPYTTPLLCRCTCPCRRRNNVHHLFG